VVFPSEAEQKKAYDGTSMQKLGPQRLLYGKGGGGGGKDSQISIENVPSGISDDDIKKKFPGATGVKINKGNG
jgi:hypothetical protein